MSDAKTVSRMAWARELMTVEGVSQKDIAKAWEISESTVSRWLDGLMTSDISLHRAVVFSRLVRRPLEEIAQRMGHEVWTSAGAPAMRPLQPIAGPPIPTVSLRPAGKPGWMQLLLHLELSATNVAAIIATLDEGDTRDARVAPHKGGGQRKGDHPASVQEAG